MNSMNEFDKFYEWMDELMSSINECNVWGQCIDSMNSMNEIFNDWTTRWMKSMNEWIFNYIQDPFPNVAYTAGHILIVTIP